VGSGAWRVCWTRVDSAKIYTSYICGFGLSLLQTCRNDIPVTTRNDMIREEREIRNEQTDTQRDKRTDTGRRRERERECVYMCVCTGIYMSGERKRDTHVERERKKERERSRVCVYVCVYVCMCVCMCVYVCALCK